MNTFGLIFSTPNAGPAAETDAPDFKRSAARPAEPFDKMMNRALAKPAREPVEKPVTAKKPATKEGVARKPKPSVKENSGPDDNSTQAQVANRASNAKPCDDASSQESSESPSSTEAQKETSANASAATTEDTQAAALQQALIAAAVQSPAVVTEPVATKMPKQDVEICPVETTGQEVGSGTAAIAESVSAIAENAIDGTKPDTKPEAKEPVAAGKKVSSSKADPAKLSGSGDGGIPIQELLDKAEAVTESPVNTGNPALPKPHALATEATGTSAAEQASTMKNADQPKVAPAPEQSLPGVTVTSAAQAAVRAKPAQKAAARVEASDSATATGSVSFDRPAAPADTASANLISASSQTELRLRALDRAHDMMALHGMQLKQTNTDSLHVVIKPGAGMQLSLQMKQTSDGIEAQAILQQGNFQDLNKHWAELQQRLEERGIRLAPLGNDGAATAGGNENFQQNSREYTQPDSLSAGAYAEYATATAATPRVPQTAPASARGWESWA